MHEPQFQVELLNQIEFLLHVPLDHFYREVIWYPLTIFRREI